MDSYAPVASAIRTAMRCQQGFSRKAKSRAGADIFRDHVFTGRPGDDKEIKIFFDEVAIDRIKCLCAPVPELATMPARSASSSAFFSCSCCQIRSWAYGEGRRIVDVPPAPLSRKALHGRGFECIVGRFDAGERGGPGRPSVSFRPRGMHRPRAAVLRP